MIVLYPYLVVSIIGIDSAAGGIVYKIDGSTGQAFVFATLPQQVVTLTNEDCESLDIATRTNSGVGLGKIVYDEINDQYFVSNIEDGRIYRISNNETINQLWDKPLPIETGIF